jgi:hypothetical protein
MAGVGRDPDPAVAYRWHPNVASRVLDGVAFLLLGGRMLRLNQVGTRMWQHFEHGATYAEVAERIHREFDVDPERAARDADAWVQDLCARSLLVRDDSTNPPANAGGGKEE